MRMTFATIIFCAWLVAMLGAFTGLVWNCVRKGRAGIVAGLQMLLGSFLLFGFVSGVVGWYEVTDYSQSLPFWGSIAIGLVGLVLIRLGVKGTLQAPPDRVGPD